MIGKRLLRVTPVRIEFNVQANEFNIRPEITTLLKKMWEGAKSLKIGSVVNKEKQWGKDDPLPESKEDKK